MTPDSAGASRPSVLRRHRRLTAVVVTVLAAGVAVGAYAAYLNSQLGDFGRFESRLHPELRAPSPTGSATKASNILLLGTDKGSGGSIESELADGEWTPGAFRSDTVMLVHIPADREQAYLVSIPRDSYVRIPGHGRQKANAAFALGGPDLTVRTLERLTGVYIDHVAMIDWAGFKELTHAIGGVEVTVPETFTDPHNDRTWEAGTYTLEGAEALAYVRTRYGLEHGDFDRINRQQNFLRAVLEKIISRGTLANPFRLTQLLGTVAEATTVDSGWSPGEMRRLALDMRGITSEDVAYLTAPTRGIGNVEPVGSVVLLDRRECQALWQALRDDAVQRYLDEYGGDTLPEAGKVR